MCQDTGTARSFAKKGQQVWTGANDAEWISRGVYEAYTKENLRYSQTAPLDMWKESQHRHQSAGADRRATRRRARNIEFLFVAKGGGSANKMFLFQETKALLNPKSFEKFVADKLPLSRHGRLPALPPGVRHRRHQRRSVHEDAEARLGQISRCAADDGQRARPRVSRSRDGSRRCCRSRSSTRHRRAVWRKIFRARCARGPACRATARAARSAWASRAAPIATSRRRSRSDGIFLEKLETNPGPVHSRRRSRTLKDDKIVQHRSQPADGGNPRANSPNIR